ncbi:DUF3054 domain-containing protein [Isoptericola sp. BMS4]|uniref:DUF3054 domain-containing protein n=1 Tax=Isoptericola sp. BMS4 TaxID=2527875 RepID=UPI0014202C9E|nr:DUF3054 domain-containing protein [Isoptericola sp. BMS4]
MLSAPGGDHGFRGSGPSAGRRISARAYAGLVVLAAAADVVCVLGLGLLGVVTVAPGGVWLPHVTWPFVVAAAVGWLAARAWRRPWRLWPTGVVVWGCTWAVGVALRVLVDRGVFPTFQIVSFGFLAATMLGWRGALALAGVLRPAPPRVTVQMDEDDGSPT